MGRKLIAYSLTSKMQARRRTTTNTITAFPFIYMWFIKG
jgi:hypothetical protein